MTPDQARALLPIFLAFAAGKTIEHRSGPLDAAGAFTWIAYGGGLEFDDAPENYRIRPEPAKPPLGSTDAHAWAKSFVEHISILPHIAADVDTMTGWFANAMMATSDHIMRAKAVETACPACIGSGTDQSTIDADGGNPDGDKCRECGGSGQRPTLRVQYEPEDRLPTSGFTLGQSVFHAMHRASQPGTLDGVAARMYPYVEIEGRRFYLVRLTEN